MMDRYNPPADRMRQGEHLRFTDLPSSRKRARGIFEAAADGGSYAFEEVSHRWRSLFDEESDNIVPRETFEEATKGLPLEWDPRMTNTRMEYQIREAHRAAEMENQQSRPLAELIGALPVWALDLTNIATMPVGAGAMAAARSAKTIGQAMAHAARGGMQVGLASAPFEVGLQLGSMDEVRADYLLMSTLAPAPFAGLMGAGGHALRSFRTAPGVPQPIKTAIVQAQLSNHPTVAPFEVTARQVHEVLSQKNPNIRSANLSQKAEPHARMDLMFEEYPGGARQWVADVASGNEIAISRATDLGIDLNSPALTNYIRLMADRSRSVPKDLAKTFTQLQDLNDFMRNAASAEQVQRLKTAGMLHDAERLAQARRNPNLVNEEDITRVLSKTQELDNARKDMQDYPEFAALARALKKNPTERTAQEADLVQAFQRNGADGVYETSIRSMEADITNLNKKIRTLKGKKKKPKDYKERLAQLHKRKESVYDDIQEARARASNVIDERLVDTRELMSVLEAAKMESQVKSPVLASTQKSTREMVMREGLPEMDDIEKFAIQNGLTEQEVTRIRDAFENTLAGC